MILHHGTGLCMEVGSNAGKNTIMLKDCDVKNSAQKWHIYVQDIRTTPAWAKIAEQIDKYRENWIYNVDIFSKEYFDITH